MDMVASSTSPPRANARTAVMFVTLNPSGFSRRYVVCSRVYVSLRTKGTRAFASGAPAT
jgi:hypothetical protein